MSDFNLLTHLKNVAHNNLRIWAAPFVAVIKTAKEEFNRPTNSYLESKNKNDMCSRCDRVFQSTYKKLE
jgi:hypothetical protein